MESRSHALFAGLFTIVLGLGLAAGAVWLEVPRGPAGAPIDLVTTHSVAGLSVDAPVRYRGVDVGRVKSIAFDKRQEGRIRVRIAVDPAAPLTRATYAKLSYQGLNGVALIQLDDDARKSREPLRLPARTVPEIELQPGLLEQAEEDVRDVLLKTGRVAGRLEALLSDENTKRIMALVDSLKQTSDHYGRVAQDLDPSVKALPHLLQQAQQTVQQAQGTAERFSKLAEDVDGKLIVLDRITAAATQIDRAVSDLHADTMPRLDALLDTVSLDARELQRTLQHSGGQPQSFIFGLPAPPPGPGERGFIANTEIGASK